MTVQRGSRNEESWLKRQDKQDVSTSKSMAYFKKKFTWKTAFAILDFGNGLKRKDGGGPRIQGFHSKMTRLGAAIQGH